MKEKVRLFIDKKDIEVKFTDDKIINITGMIGSGKTTKANEYRKDDNYIVISLDCLYRGQDKMNMNEETMKINTILGKKLPEKNNEKFFKEYYYEILRYISKYDKSVIWVLEGQQIYRFLDLEDIKGSLIVKRTCISKCWKRSITRHIKNKRKELYKGEITKKQYYDNIFYLIKRRTKQLKYFKDLNKFLYKIYNYKLL